MLLLGVGLMGMVVNLQGALLALGVMVLAGATFIAFGSLIATFTSKADVAGYVFFFTLMPFFFVSGYDIVRNALVSKWVCKNKKLLF